MALEITNSTSIEDVYVHFYENGLPQICVAEVLFHDETFFIQFGAIELLRARMGPTIAYSIDCDKTNELTESFKTWFSNHEERFWDTLTEHDKFYKYRDQ